MKDDGRQSLCQIHACAKHQACGMTTLARLGKQPAIPTSVNNHNKTTNNAGEAAK
jgi:hypothetical protein